MELNESEKATILRSLETYKKIINFSLRNCKSRRFNPEILKFIDLYNNDLLNIECLESYFK